MLTHSLLCRILKVWDRDSLTLQASLHGHADFIIDVGISKCNRFIASAGKDAQVIVWDLKLGKIIKRLKGHNQQINRIVFVTPKVKGASASAPQTQGSNYSALRDAAETFERESGPETTCVKNQYLLTCSDDGSINLYDFSQLSNKNNSQSQNTRSSQADYKDFSVRRSGRRGQEAGPGNAEPE